MDNLDERFTELEKRMDLLIVNQLISIECLDKVNQAIAKLVKVMQGKNPLETKLN
jgi:hypothetical protein